MKTRHIMAFIIPIALGISAIPIRTGYSGAPGSMGTCASSCHGSPGGTIKVTGFPAAYDPGKRYVIKIRHDGGEPIKQFNGSCRIGSGKEIAGTIDAGTRTEAYSSGTERNGVHFDTTDLDSADFVWTAPARGAGEVKLYIAGHQGTMEGLNTELVHVSREATTSVLRPVAYPGRTLPDACLVSVNGRVQMSRTVRIGIDEKAALGLPKIPFAPGVANDDAQDVSRIPFAPGIYLIIAR